MKKQIKRVAKVIILLIPILFNGCQKGEQGDPGPKGENGVNGQNGKDASGSQGPVGDKGPTGDKGPAGDAGAAGEKGADNFFVSDWIKLNWEFSETRSSGDFLQIFMKSSHAIPFLDQQILDKGIVLTYLKFKDEGGMVKNIQVQSGESILINNSRSTYIYLKGFSPQKVDFIYDDSYVHKSTANINLQPAIDLRKKELNDYGIETRLIVISNASGQARIAHIDWNDYNKVCDYLSIKK